METKELYMLLYNVEAATTKRVSFEFEFDKSIALKLIKKELGKELLKELRTEIKGKGLKNNYLAERIGLHPVVFSQMLSGKLNSTKHIKTFEFIDLVKTFINEK